MYQSFQEIIEIEKNTGKSFWEIIRDNDCREMEITEEEAFLRMRGMYEAMQSADEAYEPNLTSTSGLVGGDGEKAANARRRGTMLCGSFLGLVMEKAIKMGESNACMKRIVAAPTAGSCGVLPALPGKKWLKRSMSARVSAESSHSVLLSPARPEAVRQKSAPHRPWRQAVWHFFWAVTRKPSHMPPPLP